MALESSAGEDREPGSGWRVAGAPSSGPQGRQGRLRPRRDREAGRGAREDAREQQWRQVGQEGERPRGGDELSVCSEPPGGQCGRGLGRILEMEQTVFADGSGVGNVT